MQLFLIRHGLTPKTGVRLSGWTPGVHLSKAGRAQAEGLVHRFEGVHLDAIYVSPLERTRETAEPLANARGIRMVERDDVGEVHYGAIENKSLKVLAKSDIWRQLQGWPSNVRFPGGESLRETQARAVGAIEQIRAAHPRGAVAVFSHGDWIRLSLAHLMGVHIDLYRRLAVEPASVSAVTLGNWGPIIRLVNETGALAHLTPPRPPAGEAKKKAAKKK